MPAVSHLSAEVRRADHEAERRDATTDASTTESFSSDVAKQAVSARKGWLKQATLRPLIIAGIASAADYGHYY